MSLDPVAESDALHGAVRAFIAGDRRRSFEELALAIAAFQRRHVDPVRRLSRARLGERAAAKVDEIVALPTDVFRLRRVAAHDPAADVRVFRTSGTTHGQRGAHPLRDLGTYEAAALAWGRALLWDRPPGAGRAVVLAPSAADSADSSLSFMIDLFVARFGLAAAHVVGAAGLDAEATARALDAARSAGAPTLVLGTAFAFVYALDALGAAPRPLPPGSALMLTGGFKGRTREVPEAELRAALAGWLGLDPARDVVGEYGMTELSSQLWEPRRVDAALDAHPATYRPPPWLRVTAVDPETLAPLPAGARGLARFVDLANVDSSIGVQTQDLIELTARGDVRLFGRLPGATPRGCSLAIEELSA